MRQAIKTMPVEREELLAQATRVRWPSTPNEAEDGTCYTAVRIVPISEIAIPKVWQPEREKLIRSWGPPDKIAARLTSVAVGEDIDITSKLIRLSRTGIGRYSVSDGTHRLNVARDIGLKYVLAHVTDCERNPPTRTW